MDDSRMLTSGLCAGHSRRRAGKTRLDARADPGVSFG